MEQLQGRISGGEGRSRDMKIKQQVKGSEKLSKGRKEMNLKKSNGKMKTT